MCVGCLSIYLCLFSFSSAAFSSSQRMSPKCFLVFHALVNEMVFLISFSDCLLLVYGNATDFCLSTLYPETWLNLSISSNSRFFEICVLFRVFYI